MILQRGKRAAAMRVCISIKKLSHYDAQYYYKVETQDYNQLPFYVSIDPDKHEVSFYQDAHGSNLIRTFDVRDTSAQIGTPGIHARIVYGVLVQAMQAIEKNLFPENLDYCA